MQLLLSAIYSQFFALVIVSNYLLGLHMRMIPRAAPIAMRDGARGTGVRHCSESAQNHGNVKHLACEEAPTRAFYYLNSFLFFCRPLGFYGGLTTLLFLSQSRQPSAAFSTRLCTWLRKISTLWRASRAVLPVLLRPETSSRRQCVMRYPVHQIDISKRDRHARSYLRTHAHTARE